MKNVFTDHPASVGESYIVHMKNAFVTGGMMVLGGLACLLHGIFPFIFEKTGSNVLLNLTKIYISRMPKGDQRIREFSEFVAQSQNDVQKP